MSLSTITPPASEVFSFEDVRQLLDLEADETDRQTLIEGLIASARSKCESYTRLRLMTQTVDLTLDEFGRGEVILPVAPVQSIESVKYIDTSGVEQTLSSDAYKLVKSRVPSRIVPEYGQTWPTVRGIEDSVVIRMVVGFGDDASAVPPDILQAIRIILAHLFEFRAGELAEVQGSRLYGAETYLGTYVLWV